MEGDGVTKRSPILLSYTERCLMWQSGIFRIFTKHDSGWEYCSEPTLASFPMDGNKASDNWKQAFQ